jgi:hypothetical protein
MSDSRFGLPAPGQFFRSATLFAASHLVVPIANRDVRLPKNGFS